MSLTVKAYLEEGGRTKEIRRFCLDAGASANYGCLAEKVSRAFASLQGKTYEMYWKDSDGDRVTFSSNDELAEALSHKGDVFRMYLEVSEGSTDRESPDGIGLSDTRPLHRGVVCDGCQGPIRGTRYACTVCPDFDLCSGCERQCLHAEHDMLRIAKPRSGECPFVRPRCSGNDAGGPGRCGPGAWASRCGQPQGPQQSSAAAAPGSAAAAPGSAAAASGSAAAAPGSSASPDGAASDFMRRIGERVTALLAPVGDDAHMEFEESRGAPAERQTTAMTTTQGPSSTTSGGDAERPTGAEPSRRPDARAAPQDAYPRIGWWGGATPQGSTYPFWPTAAPGGANAYPWPQWPVGVPYAFPSAPVARDDVNGEQHQQDAVLEARVASAVEAMRAMGFHNDDGWLTAILRSNGCDMPKAIDEVLKNGAGRRP